MKDKQRHKELVSTLRGLKPEELAVRERDLREELFLLRFKAQSGQLEKNSDIRKTRKMIARIRTIETQRKEKERAS
jgi:large subunit ribosomal protein L29